MGYFPMKSLQPGRNMGRQRRYFSHIDSIEGRARDANRHDD